MNQETIAVLKVDSLKAALLIAPKKENRYYLVGVNIRIDGEGLVHVEATDG